MKRVPSHLWALLAGCAIALATGFASREAGPEVRSGGPAAGASSARESGAAAVSGNERFRSTHKQPSRAQGFRDAWKLLAARDEPMEKRLSNQRALLKAWAEVDLAGALDTAMAEAWDQEDGSSGAPPLLSAFRTAFLEDPLGAWKLIEGGRYGVGAYLLREEWVASVSAKDGLLVVSMLGDLPPSLREDAIRRSATSSYKNPGGLDAVLAKLATFPPGDQTDQWIAWAAKSIPDGGDSEELRGRWTGTSSGPGRTVAMLAWGASLRDADAGGLAAEWETIPDGEKGEAAKAVLSQSHPNSPALLPAMDRAIAAGEWDYLNQRGVELLAGHEIDPLKLADWANSLPEKEEAEPLFRSALESLMESDPTAARKWLMETNASDWHRDRALLEYTRQAVQRGEDPDQASWALDQIRDPVLKQNAMKGRMFWDEPLE